MSNDKEYNLRVGRIEFGGARQDKRPVLSGLGSVDVHIEKPPKLDEKDKRITELEAALRVLLQRDPTVEREDLNYVVCVYCGNKGDDYLMDVQHALDCAYVQAQALVTGDGDE